MKAKHTVLAVGLLALLGATAVQAEGSDSASQGPAKAGHPKGPRHGNYTEDFTHTGADGKVFKVHTEQTVNATGFERKTTRTNAEGKTATTTVTVSFDKANRTVTRTAKGTNFDGKSWSHTSTEQSSGEGHFHGGGWGGHGGHGGWGPGAGRGDAPKPDTKPGV